MEMIVVPVDIIIEFNPNVLYPPSLGLALKLCCTEKKRIYLINKIGGHGWSTAYTVDLTLYVIGCNISQLENKDTVFIQLSIMFNRQYMRLVTRNRQFDSTNFFSV